MISPEEIKIQALKWWKPFLQSYITGQPFFPKTIDRIGKVQSGQLTHRFEALKQEIEMLYLNSKNHTGIGYTVKTTGRNFRRTGTHELPDSVIFEIVEDYVSFIGRKKEWKQFLKHYELIVSTIPSLKSWTFDNCLWLAESKTEWTNVLKVCQYFINVPRPDLYIRQLPIEVHTKFIEENAALIQSLLNFVIPDHIRSAEQKRFAERYFLKYDEPLIRIRVLDETCLVAGKLSDISIPLSDFEHMNLSAENVLIAENKMNFLTLPPLHSTIAVWSGGGFNISHLKNATSLNDKKMFYWGDIDEHGFQILHQMRSYYSQVRSVMMDKKTFETFKEYVGDGERSKVVNLYLLDEEESKLYLSLKAMENRNRLEQEKISQSYADRVLTSLFKKE